MLYQLIYTSSAVQHMTADESAKIAACASERNFGINVTGLLLYLDGSFLQVLEGPKERVFNLLDHIETDNRHDGLMVISERDIEQREFGSWSMGFENIERAPETERLFTLTQQSLNETLPPKAGVEIATLTRSFLRIHNYA